MDLTGRVAVVTGAAVGIGRAIAQAVAAAGARTVVTDIEATGLAHTADLIRADGREAIAVRADVTDAHDVAGLIDTAGDDRIALLVNNAGGPPCSSLSSPFPSSAGESC